MRYDQCPKRASFCFSDVVYALLKEESEQHKKSIGQVVREIVDSYFLTANESKCCVKENRRHGC